MHLAIIDIDGSTLDTFADAPSALAFLGELRDEHPADLEELGVIEYRNGQRFGPPMLAVDFIARAETSQTEAAIAQALEHVPLDTILAGPSSADSDSSGALIDIEMPLSEADSWATVIGRADSHLYPLAA